MAVKKQMEVAYRKIGELNPASYNPRSLSEKEYADLRASMEKFGFAEPLVVNQHPDRKDVIVGGHQRWRIAKDLEFSHVPCVYVNLAESEERELNIRLNKNSGSWDYGALSLHFGIDDLKDWGFRDSDFGVVVSEPLTPDFPTEFPEVDENIKVEHVCPKCGYSWSGGKVTKTIGVASE